MSASRAFVSAPASVLRATDELLDMAEVAAVLRFTRGARPAQSAYKWLRRHDAALVQIGRRCVVSRRELDRVLARRPRAGSLRAKTLAHFQQHPSR